MGGQLSIQVFFNAPSKLSCGCCELRGCGWRETPEKGPQEDKKLRERWRGREDERDTGHQMPPDRPQ